MSWIFGALKKDESRLKHIADIHPAPIHKIVSNKLYLAIGGNHSTVTYDSSKIDYQFFICGLPISQDAAGILTREDWTGIFSNSTENIRNINGHFCGVLLKADSILLFTDKLGLREFHIYEDENCYYFSSRLDYLLKLGKFEINFAEFGSRWLSVNQLSRKSIVKNIIRLNCGAYAIIKNGKCKIPPYNWIPKNSIPLTTDEFSNKLKRLVLLEKNKDLKLSLGLSGGMDSRVILSYLLASQHTNWNCHTFQTEDSMDVQIAESISEDFNIQHEKIYNKMLHDYEIVREVTEYIGNTYLCESGFNSHKLMSYESFKNGEIIIDGGFGEIWRREFLARLYYLGRKHIKNNNYDVIANLLSLNRAEIFNEEYLAIMREGMYYQIENLFQFLPPVEEIQVGNWLDLFALKTRLPNYYGAEQSRLDKYITSYMPFIQPYLLDDLLNISCGVRNNNRLFRKIIRSNYPQLTRYRLAKGNISYPYHLTTLQKRIYFKVHSRGNKPNPHNELNKYLYSMREFAMDSIHSHSTKEYAAYDYNKIFNKVNSFYEGNSSESGFVDWFISFEIFRQLIES